MSEAAAATGQRARVPADAPHGLQAALADALRPLPIRTQVLRAD